MNVYVVVQFYPWFKFYFPLFLGMVICMIMSLKQRKINFEPRIKLNHNIYIVQEINCFKIIYLFRFHVCEDGGQLLNVSNIWQFFFCFM